MRVAVEQRSGVRGHDAAPLDVGLDQGADALGREDLEQEWCGLRPSTTRGLGHPVLGGPDAGLQFQDHPLVDACEEILAPDTDNRGGGNPGRATRHTPPRRRCGTTSLRAPRAAASAGPRSALTLRT